MRKSRFPRRSTVCFILLLVVGVSVILTGGVAADSPDITVTTDSSGDYTSIQNAVDNATAGDHIKVASGTYEQHTEIDKNITLYAPGDTIIANTSEVAAKYDRFGRRSGFQIYGEASPTISGFILTDWRWAISAGGSEGSWTVKDTEISDGRCGVCAAGTPGDWSIKNTTIANAGTVSGYESTGDWEITDSTIIQTDISADKSAGDLTIKNTSFRDISSDGIAIEESTGALTVSDSTIQNVTYGAIEAENTSADVVVSHTSITDSDTGIDFDKVNEAYLNAKETYDSATEARFKSGQITGLVGLANVRGIETPNTDRLLFL